MTPTALDRIGASQRYPVLAVLFVSILAAIIYWNGIGANDSDRYIRAALSWIEHGPFLPQSHWGLRHLIVLPLAGAFALFGTSELSSALPNALFAAGLVFLTCHFARATLGPAVGLVAAFLVGASVFFVDVQLEVSVHGATAFFSVAAFWAFHAALTSRRPLCRAALAGVVGAGAWLCTEAAIFIPATLFIYALLFARDLRTGIAAGVAFASVILLEMATYAAVAGDPFYRYRVDLGHGGDRGVTELAQLDISTILVRPFTFLLSDPTTTPFLVAAAAVWPIPGFRAFALHSERRATFALFGIGAMISFLSAGFMLNLKSPAYYPILAYCVLLTLAAFVCWLVSARRGALALLFLSALLALNFAIADYRDFGEYYAPRALAKHIIATGDSVVADPKTVARTKTLLRLAGMSEEKIGLLIHSHKGEMTQASGLVMLNLRSSAPPATWKKVAHLPQRPLPWTHALLIAAGLDRSGPAPLRYALSYNAPYALFETPPRGKTAAIHIAQP